MRQCLFLDRFYWFLFRFISTWRRLLIVFFRLDGRRSVCLSRSAILDGHRIILRVCALGWRRQFAPHHRQNRLGDFNLFALTFELFHHRIGHSASDSEADFRNHLNHRFEHFGQRKRAKPQRPRTGTEQHHGRHTRRQLWHKTDIVV